MLSELEMKTYMKMNKIGAVALLALVLLSCRSEAPKEAWRKMDYPVRFTLAGRGGNLRAEQKGTSPVESFANEHTIENLTVVVFTDRRVNNEPLALEKVITYDEITKPTDPYQGEFNFDMGMAGIYHLEIIANAYPNGDAAAKQALLDKLKHGLSYDQFKKLRFDRALPEHGGSGFAMLSTQSIKVTTQKSRRADAGKIVLRRLACRFDILNKLPDELTLTKVTLQNQITASYLITQKDIPVGAGAVAKEYTAAANSAWFTPTELSGGIYSYENPVPGATKLLLEGAYKGQEWHRTIELQNADGEELSTQRNHIYRVHLTKGNEINTEVSAQIEVLDWGEDAALDYNDDNVLDAEMINPLKFVAEYDINREGNAFSTDPFNSEEKGLFNAFTAVTQYSYIKLGGEEYHLPSFEEWKSIVPTTRSNPDDSSFIADMKYPIDISNYEETVEVAGERLVCRQDFKNSVEDTVCYALRFKGTKYQSAWKYEGWMDNDNCDVFRITTRNVPDGVTITDVANAAFWQSNNKYDEVRIFKHAKRGPVRAGTLAYCQWAALDPQINPRGWGNMIFFYDGAATTNTDFRIIGIYNYLMGVRLFKGARYSTFTLFSVTADKYLVPLKGGTIKLTAKLTTYEGVNPMAHVREIRTLRPDEYYFDSYSKGIHSLNIDETNKTIIVAPQTSVRTYDWGDLLLYPKNSSLCGREISILVGDNPLEYVAEYNINKTGNGFVTDMYATNVSGYFDFNTAVSKFSNIKIWGESYHLPSSDEWKSIVPIEDHKLYFDESFTVPEFSENVTIAGRNITCKQEFTGKGNNVIYGLRFKGTGYQTAWKYEFVKVNGYRVLRVTARNVENSTYIGGIADEEFWQKDKHFDIVRIFPASGWFDNSGTLNYAEDTGRFNSCTKTSGSYHCTFLFSHTMAALRGGGLNSARSSVRLFKDKL